MSGFKFTENNVLPFKKEEIKKNTLTREDRKRVLKNGGRREKEGVMGTAVKEAEEKPYGS